MSRPETGTMKFGDDWRGVFIRGDNAFYYAMLVEIAIDCMPDTRSMDRMQLDGLRRLLAGADERQGVTDQALKPFDLCRSPRDQGAVDPVVRAHWTVTTIHDGGAGAENNQREDTMTKKKESKLPRFIVDEPKKDVMHVRNTVTGDRYAVDKDSIVLMGLDRDGRFWMSRTGVDRVTVITTHLSPPGTGFILSPGTDEPFKLRDIEAAVVAALAVK